MLRALLTSLSSRLPSQCEVCRAWPADAVCEACAQRFAQPRPRCRTCALLTPPGVTQCGACLTAPPPLDLCLAAVSYTYPWSDLIVSYKFNSRPGLSSSLALLLRSTPWVEPALERADLLVPMPLSPQRLQERGFNQALVLARQLSADKTTHDLLLRIKDTPPQSQLKRAQRLRSVSGAFAVDPLQLDRVKNQRVVLVDDVMTSGASLFAAASALRAAGAAHITGLVLARTDADHD
jgi:ComF family protein